MRNAGVALDKPGPEEWGEGGEAVVSAARAVGGAGEGAFCAGFAVFVDAREKVMKKGGGDAGVSGGKGGMNVEKGVEVAGWIFCGM